MSDPSPIANLPKPPSEADLVEPDAERRRPANLSQAHGAPAWRTVLSWVTTIVIAVALTLVVKTWLFTAYSIPSISMVPTLEVGDRVIVSRLSRDPARGDVIVFDRPPNDPKSSPNDPDVLIKRVIGLPNDTVTANELGQVMVNGRVIDEPYLDDGIVTTIGSPIEVGPDELLVLGDNRPASQDGRSFGPIDRDLIVGRALVRFWPFSRMGRL